MIKKSIFITLILLLLLALPATSAFAGRPSEGWQAEYYDNPSLNGSPVKTLSEDAIENDWGYGAPFPGMPVDYFSARWTTTTNFDKGNYTFSVTVDDGVRVWVDGQLIIDKWQVQSAATYKATKWLDAGQHTVQVAYFENTGEATIIFWWRQDSSNGGGTDPCYDPACEANPCYEYVCDDNPCYDPACEANPCYENVCQKPPYPVEKLVIDNSDPGFTWGGTLSYRHIGYGGYGPNYYWTQNTTTSPVNYGKWTPTFRQAGNYEVFVYVPCNNATTANLRYRIMHNGQRHDRIVNQYWYSNQWVSLGTYYFQGDNSGHEYVLAYDNTREPYASRQIAFDAVKFAPR